MSRTWHKRSQTSHFTQSKVTVFRTQSNEISRSNETSRCDRCTRWLLSKMIWPIVVTHVPVERSNFSHTLTHCGQKEIRPSRCARWSLRQTNVVVPDTVIFAVKPENGASLERSKATHSTITASCKIFKSQIFTLGMWPSNKAVIVLCCKVVIDWSRGYV